MFVGSEQTGFIYPGAHAGALDWLLPVQPVSLYCSQDWNKKQSEFGGKGTSAAIDSRKQPNYVYGLNVSGEELTMRVDNKDVGSKDVGGKAVPKMSMVLVGENCGTYPWRLVTAFIMAAMTGTMLWETLSLSETSAQACGPSTIKSISTDVVDGVSPWNFDKP